MNKTRSTFLLFLTAFIWGIAFVAQSVGMDYVGPFTLNAARFLLGAFFLIPCIFFLDKLKKKDMNHEVKIRPKANRPLIAGGISCGLILTAASTFQQIGLTRTTVGKAGFITALYIVIVPIFGIFIKKKPRRIIWVSVALAFTGLYFLCITDRLRLDRGDFFVMLGALIFALHIMVIDHFSPMVDGVRMSFIQFSIAGIFSAIAAILFEAPNLSNLLAAWSPILYAGVLSCGVAYTLQIVAQKNYDPTVASLILSLESVFSVLAGWIILKESLSLREIFGCILMFTAIILAQLPERQR